MTMAFAKLLVPHDLFSRQLSASSFKGTGTLCCRECVIHVDFG